MYCEDQKRKICELQPQKRTHTRCQRPFLYNHDHHHRCRWSHPLLLLLLLHSTTYILPTYLLLTLCPPIKLLLKSSSAEGSRKKISSIVMTPFFLEKYSVIKSFHEKEKKCIKFNTRDFHLYLLSWPATEHKKNRLNDLTNDDRKTNLPATECITECISYAWMSICQLCDFLLTHAKVCLFWLVCILIYLL